MAVTLTGFVKGDRAYTVAVNCDDTKTVLPAGGGDPVADPAYQLELEWGLVPPAGTSPGDYEAAIQANALGVAAQRAAELSGG